MTEVVDEVAIAGNHPSVPVVLSGVTHTPSPRRPRTGRRRKRMAVLGVLVGAVTVAACSSGTSNSSKSATSPGGSALGELQSGRGAFAATGWDCPDGRCDWHGDLAEIAAFARAGYGPAAESRGSAAPAQATDTTTGSAVPEPAVIHDDNADHASYLRYREVYEQGGGASRPLDLAGRRIITVVDPQGRPVRGADISVADPAGLVVARLRTYADGRAQFLPPAADLSPARMFTATITKGFASVIVPLTGAEAELRATLDVPAASGPPQVDVFFLLDSTGSMGDELDQLKSTIASTVDRIESGPGQPEVRVGMTAYRDRGDDYVTRTFDLAAPEVFAAAVQEVQAMGGGDTPEDLEQGLNDSLTKPNWGDADTIKLLFVLGDGRPHLDYPGSVPYVDSARTAAAMGVKIVAVGSSGIDDTGQYVNRQLAQATLGRYVAPAPGEPAFVLADVVAAVVANEVPE